MDNAILKDNINNFLVNDKLLSDKENQLKSFVELVFFIIYYQNQ